MRTLSLKNILFSQSLLGLFILVVLNYGKRKRQKKPAHCNSLARKRGGERPAVLSCVNVDSLELKLQYQHYKR